MLLCLSHEGYFLDCGNLQGVTAYSGSCADKRSAGLVTSMRSPVLPIVSSMLARQRSRKGSGQEQRSRSVDLNSNEID
jgi:hypothetical protein